MLRRLNGAASQAGQSYPSRTLNASNVVRSTTTAEAISTNGQP
jgi:hypothetical protein